MKTNFYWVPENTMLNGDTVELIPLNESHFEELWELAKDERIWEHIPKNMSSRQSALNMFAEAIDEREKGTQFPFVIFHKAQKKLIGSTRLLNIEQQHRKLEIGWTWLHPDYWGTEINLECKLLLLTFCFDQLKTVRVWLKTDENNIRSRKAIAKIGGTFEGIFRQDWIRDNGTIRNTAYFSILANEWTEKKVHLQTIYKKKTQ
jgi:RimJ/RimL family protein N-acetyltransferase